MAKAANFGEAGNAVVGADEFARALRKMDRDLYREMTQANRAIGTMVVKRGRAKAASYSSQAKKASGSMRVASARSGINLSLGGGRWPYALGAEFGALQYAQFPQWRGNQYVSWDDGVGYFFHPAIRESQEEVLDLYMQAVADAARKAGIDLNTPRSAGVTDVARQTL